jgi:hypothetical protein
MRDVAGLAGCPETELMYSATANASFKMHEGVRFELYAGCHDQV